MVFYQDRPSSHIIYIADMQVRAQRIKGRYILCIPDNTVVCVCIIADSISLLDPNPLPQSTSVDSQSSSGPPVGGGTAYSSSPVLQHSHHNPVGDPTQLQLQGSSAVFMMLHVNVILWQNAQDQLYHHS